MLSINVRNMTKTTIFVMLHYRSLISNKGKMNLASPLSDIRIIEQGRLLERSKLLQCGPLSVLTQPRDKAVMLNDNTIEFLLRNLHEIELSSLWREILHL